MSHPATRCTVFIDNIQSYTVFPDDALLRETRFALPFKIAVVVPTTREFRRHSWYFNVPSSTPPPQLLPNKIRDYFRQLKNGSLRSVYEDLVNAEGEIEIRAPQEPKFEPVVKEFRTQIKALRSG